MRKSITAAVVAAALCLAIPGGTALAAHTAPAAHTGPTAALPVITVTMNGKTITVRGALVSGGVKVVSTVTGEPAGGPQFIRLHNGVTVAQFFKAAQGGPDNVAPIASIVFSPRAPQGTSSAQVSLRPGHYIAADAGPAPPAFTTFTITKAAAPARLPAPQARMSSIEFGFRGPGTLHNGDLVRFGNDGFLVHMIVAVRGASLAGAQQIAKLLKEGKERQAQQLATGFATFVNALTHGAFQQQVVHVRPGFWVLACLFDTQDHREHTTLGMERVIHITR